MPGISLRQILSFDSRDLFRNRSWPDTKHTPLLPLFSVLVRFRDGNSRSVNFSNEEKTERVREGRSFLDPLPSGGAISSLAGRSLVVNQLSVTIIVIIITIIIIITSERWKSASREIFDLATNMHVRERRA